MVGMPQSADPGLPDQGASTAAPRTATEVDLSAQASAAKPSAAPSESLWRDHNFLTMWTGQAFGQFGVQISELAIPVLAVLLLGASEFEVGVLNAANVAAFLLIGLPAGAWIDRLRKRHVMIAADLVRAAVLACVPLLWMLGALQIWHLIVAAAVIGIASVFFDVSYQSIVPSLVRPGQIAQANGKLQSTYEVANIAGPGVAGWLIGLITAPIAVLATVGTYLLSAVALIFTRDHEEKRSHEDHGPILREIAEGLRFVFTEKLLRRIVGTTAISNFASTISMTLLPLFLLRELGFTPQAMGLMLSLGAVGGLLGAVATPHIVSRIGEARTIPVSAICFSFIALLMPFAAVVPWMAFPLLAAQFFVGAFTGILYNITQVTFRQRITPARLLGRMNASVRWAVWGVMPIAALVAGTLGTSIGVVPTLWIGALGELCAAAFVVTGPFWSLRNLPDLHSGGSGSAV